MSGMGQFLNAMMKRPEKISKFASKRPELLTGKTRKHAGSRVSLQLKKREEKLSQIVMRKQLLRLETFAKMKQEIYSK